MGNDTSDKLEITGAHLAQEDSHVTVLDGVQIIVTQAFGPAGDSLIGLSDEVFDGHPAVTLKVRAGDKEGLVHLSPIHGDDRKTGLTDIPVGTHCELFCPVSGKQLVRVQDAEDGSGAGYYAIYLTAKLSKGEMVMLSDVWGHYHSRIVDDFELISSWADEHKAL